jgi:thiol-disulfide isomerase/thioredoxin
MLFLPTLAAMPASAQTDLPDLTHKLTALTPRPPAPAFTLKDLDGKTRKLSDYKGQVVLVNFWATWCPPCRREMPSLEHLYQKLKGQPFMIFAADQIESFDLVFSFTGELDPAPTFPILLDTKGQASAQWHVQGLPTSFIVDKQGRIAYRAIGGREFDHPEIEAMIRKLIHE